jgi:glycogen(starch) synthase
MPLPPMPQQAVMAPTIGPATEPSRISDMPQRERPEREYAPATPTTGGVLPDTEDHAQPFLFEIGWEVCWQLGGIYTVLRSKASTMMKQWGDRYFLVGPYNPSTAAVEFEEQPAEGVIRDVLDRLRQHGIPCHFGRWLVAGRPRVILLDYRSRFGQMDSDKYFMWKDHGIALNSTDGEVNEVVAFGFTVAEFFRYMCELSPGRPILAHFHEWMGGVAVPRLAHMRLPVSTVFTTHATLLGRYLASDNPHFYAHLPFLNAEAEAQKYNIYPRHQIEKAAAHASTVFTTVSDVTAHEATSLLGRTPEVILPNGLNIRRFAALHEFQNLHRQYKERIHEFIMGHFFPAYTFDLDNTIYLFTAGRYEYKNKGLDLYIEAMHRLNWRLKSLPDRPTVVSFIITRAMTRNMTVQTLQNHSMFEDVHATCMDLKELMGQELFMAAVRGRVPTGNELLPEDALVRLKRVMHAWRNGRQPAIVTHEMVDDAGDPILKHLRHRALFNAADDPVKVIFHPEFVSATSPLWGIDYEQFVRGCHLGIFPSYYEPWGYTPMECAALGVPAVTTDLSGFGAYVQRHVKENVEQGMVVINRTTHDFEQSANDLTDYLFHFVQMNRRQRIEQRNRVERLSEMFDWSVLSRHYAEAHELALQRRGAHRAGSLEVRVV